MFQNLLLVTSVLLTAWPSQSDDQSSYDVEHAARAYRIQVYNSFRTNRPQFDRLQDVGVTALDAWKVQGRQPAQAQQVIDWYTQATSAARAGKTSLPQVPEFVSSWRPSEPPPQVHGPIVAGPSRITQHPASQFGQPDAGPNTAHSQPNTDRSDENSRPSLVRGLGRALLRTVGAGGSGDLARPAASGELPTQTPSDASVAGHEPPAPEATPADLPQVDLDDLKARVDGLNPTIATVNQILESDDPVSIAQMAILTEELETLVQNFNDLQPYLALNSLSASDRSYVGGLVSPRDAVDRLRKRIQEASAELEPTPDSADNGATSDELSRLENLLERVDNLKLAPQS